MSNAADRYDATLSCRTKGRYDTESDALGVAARVFEKRGHWLRAYECTDGCGGWHLTHKGALPPANANWRPPAKSQRQLARERNKRRDRRRRRF